MLEVPCVVGRVISSLYLARFKGYLTNGPELARVWDKQKPECANRRRVRYRRQDWNWIVGALDATRRQRDYTHTRIEAGPNSVAQRRRAQAKY